MELTNEFEVQAPIDETWAVLTDLERIAPCMPGAQLQEVDGDEYRGIVKVKVGPITAQFKGAARFVEQDVAAHKAVLSAEGRDTGGKGNASATITAQLAERGAEATHVVVTTDLHITGKVAQFGRGALADVSTKLLKQFVEQLETTVLRPAVAEEPAAAAEAAPVEPAPGDLSSSAPVGDAAEALASDAPPVAGAAGPSSGPRKIDSPEAQPVDLVGAAGVPVLKRLAPVVGAVVGLLALRRFRRRRARKG